MRALVFCIPVLLVMTSCRGLTPGRYERLDTCAASLPIFRTGETPNRHYRVLGVVSGKSDFQLAYRACKLKADAVVDAGIEQAWSSSSASTRGVLQAQAVRFIDAENAPAR